MSPSARSLLFLALVLPAWAVPCRAQEKPPITVQVSSDRTRATVGDRILLKITVTHPADVTVLPPGPIQEGGGSLVLEAVQAPAASETPASEAPGGEVREIFYFHVQAFETGTSQLPAFRVDWRGPDGKAGEVTSEPIPLEIASVLKGPEEEPSDLKPPAELPPPPFPWKAAGLSLLPLALLAGAVYLWRRRKRPDPAGAPVPAGPMAPPHETAYRELERLLASALLREGRIKEFHVELAEIIKRYLAGRFGIETLERTTWEVLEELRRVRVGTASQGRAGEFLRETDLVKFAKHLPREDEIRRTVDLAYRLVDETKMVISAPASPVGEAPAALSPEAAP